MSDGQPHPNASVPVIDGPDYGHEGWFNHISDVKVTSSRLAMTAQILPEIFNYNQLTPHFLVWDWKTGVKCVVSGYQNSLVLRW